MIHVHPEVNSAVHLFDLQSHAGACERLKLFPGDVLHPESLASAMHGTSHLLHMAAFVKLTSTRKEQQLMMDIAVDGTNNLLSKQTPQPLPTSTYSGSDEQLTMMPTLLSSYCFKWFVPCISLHG
jgi:nucleoside-diphosphate-sugar epimerase